METYERVPCKMEEVWIVQAFDEAVLNEGLITSIVVVDKYYA